MSAQQRRAMARALRTLPTYHAGAQVHLLANALELAVSLLHKRPDAAEDLLALLVAYLRETVSKNRPLVPLAEELRLVLAFLAVERVRLGGRLRIEIACPRETLAALM